MTRNGPNRRQAIRFAVSTAFAMALGKYDALAQGPTKRAPDAASGVLTVDLNQWSHVTFKLGGKTIRIPMAEVFEALQEGPGGALADNNPGDRPARPAVAAAHK